VAVSEYRCQVPTDILVAVMFYINFLQAERMPPGEVKNLGSVSVLICYLAN